MKPDCKIRSATHDDLGQMLALLPQLADFDIPERRHANDLWEGDAALLIETLAGTKPDSFADVAEDQSGVLLGLALITMQDEPMSHAPSAHLEAFVVAPHARGKGFGRALLRHTEKTVRARGALSLSLHVFSRNKRAHQLYQAEGFDSELIRAIKWLD